MAEELKVVMSDDDLKIYNDESHIRIFAGPGAGKTHLLVENVKAIVENSKKLKNSSRKILCITYTNAAADEMRNRLGSYARYVFVSTIHSFINEYILSPNQLQLKLLIKELFQIDIPKNNKVSSQQEGFTTLSGHSKEKIFEFIAEKFPTIDASTYNSLSKRRMVGLSIDISNVNQVASTGDENVKINYEASKVEKIVADAIKAYTWSVAGRLTFDETLFFGMKLIKKFDIISHLVRVEFPYIFVDEYQDTNPIQNIIIKKIVEKGCVLTVVGDIAQSIYSFQGASYLEFANFNINSTLSVKSYLINGNRRSTQNIIEFANYIRKSDSNLTEQVCAKNFNNNAKVTFIIQNDPRKTLPQLGVVDLSSAYVLCRRWTEAFTYIDDIESEQLKLIENINNTYTYQLNRDMFTEVEAKQEAWIDSAIVISELIDALKRKCVPTAIGIFQRFFDIDKIITTYSNENASKFNEIIKFWEDTFAQIDDNTLLSKVVFDVNKKINGLGIEITEHLPYPETDSEDYFEPVYKNVDKITFKTARKMAKEIFTKDSRFMTIHRAKGREFDTVIVNCVPFANESKNGINTNSVLLNPVIISDAVNLASEEFTRILYVGFSRAINKLYVHLYGDDKLKLEIEKTLNNFKVDAQEMFFDFIIC